MWLPPRQRRQYGRKAVRLCAWALTQICLAFVQAYRQVLTERDIQVTQYYKISTLWDRDNNQKNFLLIKGKQLLCMLLQLPFHIQDKRNPFVSHIFPCAYETLNPIILTGLAHLTKTSWLIFIEVTLKRAYEDKLCTSILVFNDYRSSWGIITLKEPKKKRNRIGC